MGKSLAAAKPALKDIKKDASKFIKSSKTKRLQAQLSKVHAYGKSPRMTKDEKRRNLQMASERNMPPIKIAEAVGRLVSNISRLLKKKKETQMGGPYKGTSRSARGAARSDGGQGCREQGSHIRDAHAQVED